MPSQVGKLRPAPCHVAKCTHSFSQHKSFPFRYDRYEAEMLYSRTMQIREASLGPDHLLLATTLFHLGRLLMKDISFSTKQDALTLLTRSLDIRTQKLGGCMLKYFNLLVTHCTIQ